jgi:hypothetical protein
MSTNQFKPPAEAARTEQFNCSKNVDFVRLFLLRFFSSILNRKRRKSKRVNPFSYLLAVCQWSKRVKLMIFDVVLPSVLFICASAALSCFLKYEKRTESAIKGEFRCRDAVLIVVLIGLTVSIIAVLPENVVMFGFLCYFAIALFQLAQAFVGKWYLSILSPASFTALYFLTWNRLFMNLVAIATVVFATPLLSAQFSRETKVKIHDPIFGRRKIFSSLVFFVVLIVLADVTLVFGTNLMETAARKIVELQLPLFVILPTFPSAGSHMGLGLGDIFLSGLLGILTAKKMGRKAGILSILSITATFLLGETIMLNFNVSSFPATILVVLGWLVAIGMERLHSIRTERVLKSMEN